MLLFTSVVFAIVARWNEMARDAIGSGLAAEKIRELAAFTQIYQ